jgi:hypothetical protein
MSMSNNPAFSFDDYQYVWNFDVISTEVKATSMLKHGINNGPPLESVKRFIKG